MEKILNINGTEYKAIFIDHSEYSENNKNWTWQIPIVIDGEPMDIEIERETHKQSEIDWEHFSNFISFITRPKTFSDLVSKSEKLALEMGRSFFSYSSEVISWSMGANSIYYNGKPDTNMREDYFSFSLIYYFSKTVGNEVWGDDYGIYLVDCEHYTIVGCRRLQC